MELECTVVRAVKRADWRMRAVVGMRVKITFDADQPESVTVSDEHGVICEALEA